MRKKNLILLTSITGLLLTLTPSQALAQETSASTTPTSTSQSSDNKEFENEKDKRLPTDEKCHWKGKIPVPENKYLKLLYDYAYGNDENNDKKNKNSGYLPQLKELVDEGKMSENEAEYRTLLYMDRNIKAGYAYTLYFNVFSPALKDNDKELIKDMVNDVYDNPENADEITQEIIDSYSLKEFLEYADKYINPDIHISYSSKELHDKYQKEFDELEKTVEYDKNNYHVWGESDNFKVVKKLDEYSSDEEQVQRLMQLRTWLQYFPTKEEIENNDNYYKGMGHASAWMVTDFPELLDIIKEKGLDNDEFYQKAKEYFKTYEGDWNKSLSSFLKEYGIEWKSIKSGKAYPHLMEEVYTVLFNPDFEIPRDVVCDDEEETPTTTPEDTTNPDTPDTPDTDKSTTTTTSSKQDKPSTKTSTKSSDDSLTSTTPVKEEDKEENIPITTTPNNTPNTPNNPKQVNTPNSSFTPVNNTKPGTFNGGVSSSVEGEEISDGGKVDTGSPTTSLLNKIRTIF